MLKKPLISILMNCFNGELYLKESLDSVIAQSYDNWELIFWDNRSSDKSLDIVSLYKDKRIKVFRAKKHSNLGRARKHAFSKTKGEYLAFIDVDDYWYPDKLEKQIKVFVDKEVGISYTNTLFFSQKWKEKLYKPKYLNTVNTRSLISRYSLALVSIMLDINKLKKLEYSFDDKYSHICDFDLIVRLSTISKVKYIDKLLSGWRIHENNESFKRKEIFNKELGSWCDYHINNKFLEKYINEINELKLLVNAERRIFNYKFKFFSFIKCLLSKTSNIRNRIYLLFSFIPFIPKIILKFKEARFKSKWY
tara:strand:+ start:840 stop:1760 length:921 start_codon:yes stop_codon:yes gene_type:complete